MQELVADVHIFALSTLQLHQLYPPSPCRTVSSPVRKIVGPHGPALCSLLVELALTHADLVVLPIRAATTWPPTATPTQSPTYPPSSSPPLHHHDHPIRYPLILSPIAQTTSTTTSPSWPPTSVPTFFDSNPIAHASSIVVNPHHFYIMATHQDSNPIAHTSSILHPHH
mmetsp:Transcript_18962/g.27175  ORF Transcript_18962/g.27175 Transcript_18962/m.27175 type:complete len:169 (+) Transcript_18962:373-879(+)